MVEYRFRWYWFLELQVLVALLQGSEPTRVVETPVCKYTADSGRAHLSHTRAPCSIEDHRPLRMITYA